MASDNSEQLQQWLDASLVGHASDDDARAWASTKPEPQFLANGESLHQESTMTANEKNTGFTRMGSLLTAASVSLALVASCGGRSSSDAIEGGRTANSIETQSAALLDSETAVYQVTVRNFWGPDDFPQGFPDGAHLSLFGGAIHNASVSFWQIGEPPSRGIEDMAEAGLIDILLSDDVSPAIAQGTASSFVEVRRFTESSIDGEPGTLEFEASLTRSHPLITMTSMLGPSPDWFVGVSGLSLLNSDDGDDVGGGVGDETTGVYLPSETPQIVAEFEFVRLN